MRRDCGRAFAVFSDITDRKGSEDALKKSEMMLREAQRVARVGSWEWDPERDEVTWSDEIYNFMGRDPRQPAPSFGGTGRAVFTRRLRGP